MGAAAVPPLARSEEHTSELQSPCNVVCRLLLVTNSKPCRDRGSSVIAVYVQRTANAALTIEPDRRNHRQPSAIHQRQQQLLVDAHRTTGITKYRAIDEFSVDERTVFA